VDEFTALRVAREYRKLGQVELGRRGGPMCKSMISMCENGLRRLPLDVRGRVARILDHPATFSEFARGGNGNVGPAYYDGPGVDHHRLASRDRALKEMREACEAFERFWAAVDALGPADLDADGKRQLAAALHEAAAACDSTYNAIGDLCLTYDESLAAVWDHRNAELQKRGYISKGREASVHARAAS
jgi:hypothetical protein